MSRSSVPEDALAQHRHRRDEEHRDEREEPDERPADVLEHPGLALEDLLQEHLEHDRHDDDERDRPRVAAELLEDAAAPSRAWRAALMRCSSTRRRKTSSSRSAPVRSRSSCGVPVAISSPSRRSRSESQRSASSITWLETTSVAPAAASSWKVCHRSRRRSGSRPTVGSSRTRSSRLAEERRRERDAGALAAGEVADAAIGELGEADGGEDGVDARRRRRGTSRAK